MDEVKGRILAACCLDDTVLMFQWVKGFVYIRFQRVEKCLRLLCKERLERCSLAQPIS